MEDLCNIYDVAAEEEVVNQEPYMVEDAKPSKKRPLPEGSPVPRCKRARVYEDTETFLSDLQPMGKVVKGNFGKMTLVMDMRRKLVRSNSRPVYTLIFKEKKSILEKEGGIEGHNNNLRLLMKFRDHPFILSVMRALQTEHFCVKMVNQCGRFSLDYFIQAFVQLGLEKFPADIARVYLSQLSTALDFLHDRGFILRNFHPDSFIVDAKSNICIADLSLAVPLNHDNSKPFSQEHRWFMAPEVVRGEACNPSADFYGLGALGYFLVEQMYPEPDVWPSLKFSKKVPTKLRCFIWNCLTTIPNERPFQSFDDAAKHALFKNVCWMNVLNKIKFSDAEEVLEWNMREDVDDDEEDLVDLALNCDDDKLSEEEQRCFDIFYTDSYFSTR